MINHRSDASESGSSPPPSKGSPDRSRPDSVPASEEDDDESPPSAKRSRLQIGGGAAPQPALNGQNGAAPISTPAAFMAAAAARVQNLPQGLFPFCMPPAELLYPHILQQWQAAHAAAMLHHHATAATSPTQVATSPAAAIAALTQQIVPPGPKKGGFGVCDLLAKP